MFTDGVRDHPEYYRLMNHMQLEICQISDAAFFCRSRNRYPFNRIFAVKSAGRKRSDLFSHSCGERLEMKPGCFYFMTAGTDLEFEFQPDTKFFAFHFNLRVGARDLFSGHDFLKEVSGKRQSIEKIEELMQKETPGLCDICSMKSILLQEIADFLPGTGVWNSDLEYWEPVLQWIQQHADATTMIEELAFVMKFSHDTFTRKFSKEFRISPKLYLEMELARKAGILLTTTSKSLNEIARELKFSDIYYFYRFFRKMTGVPPGQYRKQTARI